MNTFYNEILTDHNLHPGNKHDLPDANYILEGVNPSCGDDIILKLRVEDGMVKDGAYTGDGCAISQASADIMLDLVIGKSVQEAEELSEIFVRMITGSISGEEAELRKTVHYDPDILFSKHGYGMPERMLKWLDPEVEYDIVGCDLDACVLAVCFQLWDRGIRFHILSEYVYTGFSSGFTHENVRMIMRKNFGDRYCRNTANLFKKRGWKLCRKKRRKMVRKSRDRESVSERKEKI